MKKHLLIFCLISTTAFSEEVLKLEKTQITATRVERPELDIPAGVETVTKDEIEMERQYNVSEFLESLPGIQATTKNGGYDVRLIIRGGGLKAPYAVREINILLDGVPITDPDGFTRLDFVDPQLLEEIDIVKGPNSTLYGANSAGGVVNFITINPFKFQGFKIRAGYGNYGTYMSRLLYGGNNGEGLFYNASFSYKKSDSWREWNRFESFQTAVKLGWLIDESSSLETMISFTKSDLQLPGSLSKSEFESGDITKQSVYNTWRRSGRYSRIFFWSNKYTKEVSENLTLKSTIYLQRWAHYHPVFARVNDGGSYVGGIDTQMELKHKLFGKNALLVTGIQGRYDHYNTERYLYQVCILEDGTVDYCRNASRTNPIKYVLTDDKDRLYDDQKNRNYTLGIFAQETIYPTEKVILDLGIRFDTVKFDIEKTSYYELKYWPGYYYSKLDTPEYTETSKTWNMVSPRLGIVYKFIPNWSVYGTVSTGFQTPQDSELLANPDLDASTTVNYEIGTRFVNNKIYIASSIFMMKTDKEIVQTYDSNRERIYVNAGKTTKKGFEFEGKINLFDGVFFGGSYTYYNFKYDSFVFKDRNGNTYDFSGNKLYYIPEYMYSLFLTGKHKTGIKFRIELNTWGPYYIDNANTEKYDDYKNITNVMVGYEKGKKFEISLDVRNLFDKKYASQYVKSDTGDADDDYYIYPAPPRTYMIRASYKF
ncbi:TonB-dependent receptor [Persephonella sp. KM09-Lau-8]|uniref:TonB-dependent receptor n=1 Tax=Persephonella sp. KM09-Lau-8 TaxID=1158345 RepID=UPI000497BABD|nr:TonB-dependent receptor [Persephonella sp. KM09-Lau-8]